MENRQCSSRWLSTLTATTARCLALRKFRLNIHVHTASLKAGSGNTILSICPALLKTRAGRSAVEFRRGRALYSEAAHFRSPAYPAPRRGRRVAIDRCDPISDERRTGARLSLSRHAFRLRQQTRLFKGNGRIRVASSGSQG